MKTKEFTTATQLYFGLFHPIFTSIYILYTCGQVYDTISVHLLQCTLGEEVIFVHNAIWDDRT